MNLTVLRKSLSFGRKYEKVLAVLKVYFFKSKLRLSKNFKLAVKQAAVNFEDSHSNDIYQHFSTKTCLTTGSRGTQSLQKGYGAILFEW